MSEERDCPRQAMEIKKGGSVIVKNEDKPVKRPIESKPEK